MNEEKLREIEAGIEEGRWRDTLGVYRVDGLTEDGIRALIAEVRRLRGRDVTSGDDETGSYIEWREENGMRTRYYHQKGLTVSDHPHD